MNLRKRRKALGIPLSAMGDIAFLLLIFYMTTTMVTDQKPLDMPLPEVEAGAQSSPYPLIIYMNAELAGQDVVYFFNKRVSVKALPRQVLERAALAPSSVRVYVNIQKDLPYRYMNDVIGALKEAGIRRMVITTRAPAGPGQGVPN